MKNTNLNQNEVTVRTPHMFDNESMKGADLDEMNEVTVRTPHMFYDEVMVGADLDEM